MYEEKGKASEVKEPCDVLLIYGVFVTCSCNQAVCGVNQHKSLSNINNSWHAFNKKTERHSFA